MLSISVDNINNKIQNNLNKNIPVSTENKAISVATNDKMLLNGLDVLGAMGAAQIAFCGADEDSEFYYESWTGAHKIKHTAKYEKKTDNIVEEVRYNKYGNIIDKDTYNYDAQGKFSGYIRTDGKGKILEKVEIEYDPKTGNKCKRIDICGDKITESVYNPETEKLVRETQKKSNGEIISELSYKGVVKTTRRTMNGVKATQIYNWSKNAPIEEVYEYSDGSKYILVYSAGRLKTKTYKKADGSELIREFSSYDGRKIASITDKKADGTSCVYKVQDNNVVETRKDANGKVVLENIHEYSYDKKARTLIKNGEGKLIAVVAYQYEDESKRIATKTIRTVNGALVSITFYEYDEDKNKVTETIRDNCGKIIEQNSYKLY